MKTLAAIFVLMICLSGTATEKGSDAVDEVAHAMETWRLKNPSQMQNLTDKGKAFSARASLGATLMEQIPDSTRLMSALVSYMVKGGQGAPYTVKMVWKSISNPQDRARFLAEEVERAGLESMGYVATLIEHDLVDQETETRYPEAWNAIGLGREILFTGSAFAPLVQSTIGTSPRLVAIWFSKAPYQAAKACVVDDDEALRRLALVNKLRQDFDQTQPEDEKSRIWTKLDRELVQLMGSDFPAYQAFAAGVLKWRRTVAASLVDSTELRNAIAKANSPLVNCILETSDNDRLLSLEGASSVIYRIPQSSISVPSNPVKQGSSNHPSTRLIDLDEKVPSSPKGPFVLSGAAKLAGIIIAGIALLWLLLKRLAK